MYKLDLPIDYKEAAAIERRRNMEEQRKSRIFNSKCRTIGVDVQALEQQIHDRQQQTDYEDKRTKAFAADAVRNDKISQLLEERQKQDVFELNRALNEFRSLHQQPDSRREFDLYDPDYLKKDKPARVSDDDPRCGISSLQKFDGEDLNSKARSKYQQEQLREWSLEQQRERDQAAKNQAQADRLYELKMRELDERSMALQKAEEDCRTAIDQATADYNKALGKPWPSRSYGQIVETLIRQPLQKLSDLGSTLIAKNVESCLHEARERDEKERLQQQQTLDDNMTEISNHVFGDILTENPAVAQSAFGPHRVIPDRWKGMSPQQLEDIRRQQEQQRLEKERLRQEKDLRDKEFDRQRLANARAGMLLEREQERKREDLIRQMADENRRLAQEQDSHRNFLDKEVYTNPPTASYFMQFNTSTR